MIPELGRRFDDLEESRRNFLRPVEALSLRQQEFRPSPESWSLVQVAHHVMLVERESVRFIQGGREPGARRLKHAALSAAVRLVLSTGLRVKAPVEAIKPKEDLSLQEVASRWQRVREDLRVYLDRIPEEELERLVFRHPIAGPFNIVQTLGFLASHLRHHARQLRRIRKAAEFPSG